MVHMCIHHRRRQFTGMKQAQNALTDILFDKEGNYVQELLVDEAVKVTDAVVRDQVCPFVCHGTSCDSVVLLIFCI